MISNTAKSFDTLVTSLSILYNYFDLTKLFLNLYLIKFLISQQNRSFHKCLSLSVINLKFYTRYLKQFDQFCE